MDVHVPPGAKIGKGCVIHNGAGERELGAEIPSGKSVRPAKEGGR
jgi:hypothetical protein